MSFDLLFYFSEILHKEVIKGLFCDNNIDLFLTLCFFDRLNQEQLKQCFHEFLVSGSWYSLLDTQ